MAYNSLSILLSKCDKNQKVFFFLTFITLNINTISKLIIDLIIIMYYTISLNSNNYLLFNTAKLQE